MRLAAEDIDCGQSIAQSRKTSEAGFNMLELHGVPITDTFAEAFPLVGTRLIITASTSDWAATAGQQAAGYATSVIACDAEAGIERFLNPEETLDGRPGVSLLMFAFSRKALAKAVQGRVGQTILTCPTTACFDGLPETPKEKQVPLGSGLRHFGDGLQFSKKLAGRRFWRIPVMDGEFLCEDKAGTVQGVGGGNLLICGDSQDSALQAAMAAAEAMRETSGVILPFPGGIVRSGSKVGSKYQGLKASTNDPYCPTVRPLSASKIPDGCNAVYELVVDGLSYDAVKEALVRGLDAAARVPGVLNITAGNYGGKLGEHHFHLKELLDHNG